ncbi:SHOCT domain-containing protein [Bremerella alba]|uniref:SHOCT domain-containing protein n=1 Tax=Bremerella alba TaxID=980252 RepID=A0A7V8V613_9BACT|nr:SHOCT domain-containing protein [Bremerella alba]MBA2115501.1 hypothetical protein [Bremerella alba]
MQQLTPEGSRIVNDLAQRYGFSTDAVTHMMIAVLNGNGGMAQFSHPEFGGSGQWMQGGMMMLGDMFNYGLKNSVGGLCQEISNILANQPGLLRSGSFQSQSQSGGGQQNQASGSPMGQSSLFVPDPNQNWWPQDLGSPSSTGSQNNVQYAYFPNICRLAVKTGGDVWVYDTQNHQIGGFSQQQGMGSSITFSSQFGTVSLGTLPVVSQNGQTPQPPAPQASTPPPSQPAPSSTNSSANEASVFDAIAKLGELRDKGFLSDDEFNSKKSELLGRL